MEGGRKRTNPYCKSTLCPINPQLPREGGRKDTFMREYTTVEVEGIVRTEMKSDLENLIREGRDGAGGGAL